MYEMLDRGDLDAGQKLAMLRENALRLYGMA